MKEDVECKRLFIAHNETAFLFLDNFGNKKVNIFHHVTEVSGTIYNQLSGTGFIQGIDEDLASTVTPDMDSLCEKPDVVADRVPTPTSFFAVTSIEDIDNLVLGATTSFKPRNFVPIPPFLLKEVNKTIMKHQGSVKEVLFTVINRIQEFDQVNQDNEEFREKAKTCSKDIIFWCYLVLVEANTIKATPTTACNNVAVIRACRELTKKSLHPARDQIENVTQQNQNKISLSETFQCPLEMLATSAASNQDFLRKLTQIQTQSSEKASKSFKKIPIKYQNMLQVASSIGEVTVMEINNEALEFFKSASVLNASITLNSLLESSKIECSISSAMTTALLHGGFLWSNALTPSGLACSIITSEDLFRTDTLHEGMVLDISTKFAMSSSSLEKLTKSQVLYPVDIEGTIERLRALLALVSFFFSERSYPSQGLTNLVHKCMDNKSVLRTQSYLDQEFIAKFLCAVDDRLYQWLRQCCNAKLVEDTNLQLIDYSSLFDDILLRRFNYRLPPNIRKIQKRFPPDQFHHQDHSNMDRFKKPRLFEQVRNENQVREWKLRPNENWDTIFRKKSREGPTLSSNSKLCLKYQVKGVCYSDCTMTGSHCELKGEDKKKADAFIKTLRGE